MTEQTCICTTQGGVQYINDKCKAHRGLGAHNALNYQCVCSLSSSDARDCPVHHITEAVEVARNKLVNALGQLRYSGQLAPTKDLLVFNGTEVEFLGQVTRWIGTFGTVLQSASEGITSMAAELQELRSQKKAVRDFLGLTTTEGTP